MQNLTITQKGHIVTISFDITKDFGPSNSGKTNIVASTEGAVPTPDDPTVKIGLNVWRKPKK